MRERAFADAMRPLLILHSFRFVGLSFLLPGVVSGDLPANFTFDAAYGDIIATVLALAALAALRIHLALPLLWVFSVCGASDLLNAFYQGSTGPPSPGHLGAAFFIPTLIVPFALRTNGLMFTLLPRPAGQGTSKALMASVRVGDLHL